MAASNQYYPESVTHPGEVLLESLEEQRMGTEEFAIKTGIPERALLSFLKGESAITAEMAIKFEQVLMIPAHFWLKAQRNYDENTGA